MWLTLAVGLFFISSSVPVQAATAAPTDAVKETADAVLAVLRSPQLKVDRSAGRNRIKEILRGRFDFDEMARRSLGPAWSKQTVQDQQQFTRLFAELLMNTYIDRIEDYRGEKILYESQSQDGDFAVVHTKLQDPQGQIYSIDYRLHRKAGKWQVYDVVIEAISIVNNYRAQFSRLLNRGSFAELLQKLPNQAAQAPGA